MQKITPHLWFDKEAHEAAEYYCSVFKNSKILSTTNYPDAGQDITGQPAGAVMTVEYELDGQKFMALNGGPLFKFNESISFMIDCDGQDEVDYYWEKLSANPEAEQCGWVKDKYGLSWQVIPKQMNEIFAKSNPEQSAAVMTAMLKMKKINVAELQAAYDSAK